MSELSNIVDLSIVVESSTLEKATFSVPLIVGYHTKYADRTRSYASLEELTDDGFAVTDSIYGAAAAVFAQNPRVPSLKVGRLALPPTTKVELTPVAANSTEYKVAVNGTEYTYTSDSSATVAEICGGLVTALGTITGVTVSDQTTYVRLVATSAGNKLEVDNLTGSSLLAVAQNHNDPGIATDMAAILNADPAFYGVIPVTGGAAELEALGAWCLSNEKQMFAASQDSAIPSSAVDDVASELKGTNNDRSVLMFHDRQSQHAGASAAGY